MLAPPYRFDQIPTGSYFVRDFILAVEYLLKTNVWCCPTVLSPAGFSFINVVVGLKGKYLVLVIVDITCGSRSLGNTYYEDEPPERFLFFLEYAVKYVA